MINLPQENGNRRAVEQGEDSTARPFSVNLNAVALTQPQKDVDYTVTGLIGSDALTAAPTLQYERTPDNTQAGAYDIHISGADAGGNYTIHHENGRLTISNHPLQGTLTVSGTARVGANLMAQLTETNNTGDLSYVWLYGNQKLGTGQTYQPVDSDAGHSLTVEVTSTVETGKISTQTEVIARQSSSGGGNGGGGDSGSSGSSGNSGSATITPPDSVFL